MNHDGLPDSPEHGLRAAHAEEPNLLLRGVPLDEYERLFASLRPTRLDFRSVLIEPQQTIAQVYFVRDGVGSVLSTQSGGTVEVGLIGNEGIVGLPLLFGVTEMPYRVIIQAEGDGWRMSAEAFRRAAVELPGLRERLLAYAAYYLEQVSQSVACNRLHTLEERCARWLLMTDDRVAAEHFQITHDFIAQMLGVRRAGVTTALALLQRAEIISYLRGRMKILDRERLREASCDCYEITRQAQARLLGAATGAA